MPRSDIFSVGAVLYKLLCGRDAFPGDSPDAVMDQVLTATPDPLDEILFGTELSIIPVIEKTLDKNPELRHRDMAQLEAEIRAARLALEATGEEPIIKRPASAPSDRQTSRRRHSRPMDIARRRALQIEAYLAEAKRARDAGDVDAAMTACEEVLIIDPSSAPALALLEALRRELSGTAATTIKRAVRTLPSGRATTPPPDLAPTQPVTVPAPSTVDLSQQNADTIVAPKATTPKALPMAAAPPKLPPSPWRRAAQAAALAFGVLAAAGLVETSGLVNFGIAEVLGLDEEPPYDLPMPELPADPPPAAAQPPEPAAPSPSASAPVRKAAPPAAALPRQSSRQPKASPLPNRRRPIRRCLEAAATWDGCSCAPKRRRTTETSAKRSVRTGTCSRSTPATGSPRGASAGASTRCCAAPKRAFSRVTTPLRRDLNVVTAADPKNQEAAELRAVLRESRTAPATRKPGGD